MQITKNVIRSLIKSLSGRKGMPLIGWTASSHAADGYGITTSSSNSTGFLSGFVHKIAGSERLVGRGLLQAGDIVIVCDHSDVGDTGDTVNVDSIDYQVESVSEDTIQGTKKLYCKRIT